MSQNKLEALTQIHDTVVAEQNGERGRLRY